MAQLLNVIFSAANMQLLLNESPDKILVRMTLEEAILSDDTKAGVVKVFADAYQNSGTEPLLTVTGCPNPPCEIGA